MDLKHKYPFRLTSGNGSSPDDFHVDLELCAEDLKSNKAKDALAFALQLIMRTIAERPNG